MTNETKTEIKELLKEFVAQSPSQAKAVAKLKDVSEATVIQVLKNNWTTISVEMWRNIGKQVGWNAKRGWVIVPTAASRKMTTFLSDSKDEANVFGICAQEGGGKSEAIKQFCKNYHNVFPVVCDEFSNKKEIITRMLESMGIDAEGMNVSRCVRRLEQEIMHMDSPCFILDEFDKAKDDVWLMVITLFNKTEDKAGLLICGGPHFSKRMKDGVDKNKKGYRELNSRLGRKLIPLPKITNKEATEICHANGVNNVDFIGEILATFDGDIRRIKRQVYSYKKRNDEKGRSNAA